MLHHMHDAMPSYIGIEVGIHCGSNSFYVLIELSRFCSPWWKELDLSVPKTAYIIHFPYLYGANLDDFYNSYLNMDDRGNACLYVLVSFVAAVVPW